MKNSVNQKSIARTVGIILLVIAGSGITGCQSEIGSPPKEKSATANNPVSANDVSSEARKPISSLTEKSIDQTVAVQGEIVQQCPAVGCWLRLKDDTGELFVDLKPGDLALSEKRVGQQARITGRMVKEGGQLKLEAEKLEFISPDSTSNHGKK
ncbi:hypothetical protein MNBD_PLANCTO02-2115 [hydrothermal vent metagenome]|uniref:DUF4920 domain-containing protein n=1 Tax=hydrothermal vent metagenome TaxID=652676 RepID=A0A3B1E1I7_9ZZZZ